MGNFYSIFNNSICGDWGGVGRSCCINYHYMFHDINDWTEKNNKRYELFKMLSTIIMCLN